MENLNVKIENLNGTTLTVLQGEALSPKSPIQLKLSGTIESIDSFLKERVGGLDKSKSHVVINREKMSITLIVNEDDPFTRGEVIGKLELHPDFKKFKINSGEAWSTFDLSDLIKMNRAAFSSKDVAMKLVSQLRDFKAKVNKQIDSFKDDKANFDIRRAQAVESNLPDTFVLQVPIFKGQPKQDIPIEINIHPETLGCQLCSPDANDMASKFKDKAIDKQLENIAGFGGLVIIEE